MHKTAVSWAKSYEKELSKRQSRRFNTACVAYDKKNDRYFYGRNGGIEKSNSEKNAILFGTEEKKGLLPEESATAYPVHNCAEIDAVNNALNAGAKIGDLALITIHTRIDKHGELKEACINCTRTLKGKININYSGWYKGE